MTQSLLDQELSTGDGMNQYLQQIRKYPLLSAQEEKALAMAYAQGDVDAIRHLVTSNLRLVVKEAKKYSYRTIPLMDLIQEGSVGLLEAAKRFDYTQDYRFSTYAYEFIRGSILKYLKHQETASYISQYATQQQYKLSASRDRLLSQLGREPTEEELAEDAGVPLKAVIALQNAPSQFCSLDAPVGEEDDCLVQLLEDPLAPEPHRELVRMELKKTMDELLGQLNPRQQQVLKLYFGMDDGVCLSFDQIGKIMNITKQRANQIAREAMEKLKKLGADLGLEDFLT